MSDTRLLSSYEPFTMSTVQLLLDIPIIQGTTLAGENVFISCNLNEMYNSGNYPFLVFPNNQGYYYLTYELDQIKGPMLMNMKALQETIPYIQYTQGTLITYNSASSITINSVNVFHKKNSTHFEIYGIINIDISALTNGYFDLDFDETLTSEYIMSLPNDQTLLGSLNTNSSIVSGLLRISVNNTTITAKNGIDIKLNGILMY